MAASDLTPREKEVLDLHDANVRNVDIASQLGIAAGTVSNALVKALKKVGRESEIGGNGGGGTRTASAGGALDPEDMFKREGAKVLRRATDTEDAVENFPADFETWLEENRENLEKAYTADQERLTSQMHSAKEAAEKWTAFADKLDIDLDEVIAESMKDEAATPEDSTEDSDADADTEDSDEDSDNDDAEGDQS